jgi:hypothetical protein
LKVIFLSGIREKCTAIRIWAVALELSITHIELHTVKRIAR